MKKPKVAITGARGYLGSILAKKFQTAGWETTLLVRDARERGEVLSYSSAEKSVSASSRVSSLIHVLR